MNNPLVSICIPAYNVENYLADTIQSVLNQTYRNIEVIIVDDGSKDRSLAVAKRYENDQIKIYSQKNSGASAARNKAYSYSNGEFIKFLDGDDLINPEMIECQVKKALEFENCTISSRWGRFYGHDLNSFRLRPEKCWKNMPPVDWLCISWEKGGSMTQAGMFLIPRNIIEKSGPWDETLSLIDDLDFFTRVLLSSFQVIFEDQAILYYRSGLNGSLSGHQSDKAIKSAFFSIDKATNNLLASDSSARTMRACANVWQNFIYSFYPRQAALVKAAAERVKDLNGSDLPFACGGLTKVMKLLFGWKFTKIVKSILNHESIDARDQSLQ
ncbi:glycosyltransferase family 2 protein [Mucilaginibacter sp. McL0603]|uniref:glycosyltransferase family 2 protein n=1 Tax=Mucilaginibacter sp. McL0603 TaxID=3415670 RepID=UPI003CE91D84